MKRTTDRARTPATKLPATKPPARARASGLSRERIITAALDYLRADATAPLSIGRTAAAVGASPMAIYRHFADIDDLAHTLVAWVLDGLEADIPADADWPVQARAWMVSIYTRLRETPQCAKLIGTGSSHAVAWMRAGLTLQRILARSGLSGSALSQAVFFTMAAVSGYARQTVSAPMSAQIEGALAAIERLEPDERTELAGFAADIPDICDNALEVMIERILASIAQAR